MKLTKHVTEPLPEMYIFEQEKTGAKFTFTRGDVRDIVVAYLLENLKEDIAYNIDEMNGDEIDLKELKDITPEKFADEVYETLRGQVEDLNYPSNEYIYEVIGDTFNDYT